MRVCIFGGGAIGGLIATKFALAGEEVTVIDRGSHLAAIASNGLEVQNQDGSIQRARVKAVDKAAAAGKQDLVVLAVKAHSLAPMANELAPLLYPDTPIVTVQNGIPWWYFQKHGGFLEGTRLHSLDPDGVLASTIDVDRIVACVVYPAATLVAPGVIRHVEGNSVPIGELDSTLTDRVQAIEALLANAGLKTRILTDIRAEIWLKAIGTVAFNPISALTHATMAEICQFPDTRRLATTIMTEAQTIAEKLGITLRLTIERRIQGAEAVGAHKTSMLQDVEAGRPLELEALVGAILEMGRLTQTPTPSIDTVYVLTKLLDKRVRDEGRGIRLVGLT